MRKDGFRRVSRPGVTAVLVNRRRILLLKRISLPFMTNPGIWYFVAGARDGREGHLENAYREIGEELGVGREELKLLYSGEIWVREQKRKERWRNKLFIMKARSRKVRLNIEHRGYRWVAFGELEGYHDLTGALGEPEKALSLIKSALARS
jgi:8-oxo-dGTP pyrophosphatase MutT (NUDIX family)